MSQVSHASRGQRLCLTFRDGHVSIVYHRGALRSTFCFPGSRRLPLPSPRHPLIPGDEVQKQLPHIASLVSHLLSSTTPPPPPPPPCASYRGTTQRRRSSQQICRLPPSSKNNSGSLLRAVFPGRISTWRVSLHGTGALPCILPAVRQHKHVPSNCVASPWLLLEDEG